MSGGKWERQPNGDYQHYTDEELQEREETQAKMGGLICLIAGPSIMIYNIHDIGPAFYIGCVLALIGLIYLIMHPKEMIGAVIGLGIIAGLGWLLIRKLL